MLTNISEELKSYAKVKLAPTEGAEEKQKTGEKTKEEQEQTLEERIKNNQRATDEANAEDIFLEE